MLSKEKGAMRRHDQHIGRWAHAAIEKWVLWLFIRAWRRREFRRRLLVGFALLLVSGFPLHTPRLAASGQEETHVVVISIDGLVPDYYRNPDRYGLKIPTLRRLRNEGAFADAVIGVYPSVTYPSHTAIVTGARPRDHGIYFNRIFEEPTAPQTGRWYWWASAIRSDTLWAAARRAGRRTAAISWPVTVEAEIEHNIPEIFDPRAAQGGPPVWALVAQHARPAGLVEEILQAVGKPEALEDDDLRVEAAVYLLTRFRPHLLLLHLIQLDGVQHRTGPHSKEAYAELEKQDARIGRVLEAIRRAGLEARTTVAIVSDHGFMPVEREFHPGVVLAQAGLVKFDSSGRIVEWHAAVWSNGGSAAIFLRDPSDTAARETVRRLFEEWARRPGSPLLRVIEASELEQLGAAPTAAFFLEAADFCAFGGDYRGEALRPARPNYRGSHGYLPDRPQMFASLILWGRGVRRGARAPVVNMTDIAPTLAALLGVDLKAPAYSRPIALFLDLPSRGPSDRRSLSRADHGVAPLLNMGRRRMHRST